MMINFYRRNKLFAIMLTMVMAMWTVYFTFGQMLIKVMYEGSRIEILNNIIKGQKDHPLEYFLHFLEPSLMKVSVILLGVVPLRFLLKQISRNKVIKYGIYFLTAFFILHLFLSKWGFSEEKSKEHCGVKNMLNYTADRPWVYRVLTPFLINSASQPFLKNRVLLNEDWLIQKSPIVKYYVKDKASLTLEFSVKFHLIYVYLLLSLILLLLSMRYLTKFIYHLPCHITDSAPCIGLLFLPLTFLHGGYFYDFPELLLMAVYLICLIRQKWAFLYFVYFLAILNKESNILLILFFIAFYNKNYLSKGFIVHSIMHLSMGSIILIFVRKCFMTSAGLPMYDHLSGNIQYWTTLKNYFLFFDPYYLGLRIFPQGGNLLFIVIVLFLIFYKWREKPLAVKKLFVFTSIVNVPLLIVGGYRDEIRNLSLIFPAIYLLVTHSMYSFMLNYRNKSSV